MTAASSKVVERANMPELGKADEVFLTSSAAEVTPVARLSAKSAIIVSPRARSAA